MDLAIGVTAVEAHLHIIIKLVCTIALERETIVFRIDGDSFLSGIAAREIVGRLVVTTLKIKVMVLRQSCTEYQVYPVGADNVTVLIRHRGVRQTIGVTAVVQPTLILDVGILYGIHGLQQLRG